MSNSVIIIAGLIIIATLMLASFIARTFRKAGPNEAIIIYGIRGPRVIKGGAAVILPVVENCRQLSLELMSFDVAPQQAQVLGLGRRLVRSGRRHVEERDAETSDLLG